MKQAILPLVLLLAGCSPARTPGGGGPVSQKIVSTNPCADAILIDLVPASRIAAISQYSQDPGATSIDLTVANRFASTTGTAEEVIALKPDLVLTSSFTPASTRNAYARAGLKTLLLDSPVTIEASKAQVMQIATAVGAEAKGRALNARIDQALTLALPRRRPGPSWEGRGNDAQTPAKVGPDTGPRPTPGKSNEEDPSALLFIAGNLVNGSGTLLDELLTKAGFRDAAIDYGLAFTGTLPIETIAAKPPRVILTPGPSRTATLRARVLARTGANTVEAAFPRNLVNCGGPTIIPAITRLAAIRREITLEPSPPVGEGGRAQRGRMRGSEVRDGNERPPHPPVASLLLPSPTRGEGQ